MGIRIHKMMGYGLTDVKHRKGKLVDPRFSRVHLDMGYVCLDDERLDVAGYLEFLQAKKESDEVLDKFDLSWEIQEAKKDNGSLYGMINYDAEYGLGNVLCVIPLLGHQQWRRYDNTLDYTEETCFSRSGDRQSNWVRVLEWGIYPYNASWMDARTGERFKTPKAEWAHELHFEPHKPALKRAMQRAAAEQLGFASAKEALKCVVPIVPEPVRYLCEYAQLFKDPATMNELRPMIYVYWG